MATWSAATEPVGNFQNLLWCFNLYLIYYKHKSILKSQIKGAPPGLTPGVLLEKFPTAKRFEGVAPSAKPMEGALPAAHTIEKTRKIRNLEYKDGLGPR